MGQIPMPAPRSFGRGVIAKIYIFIKSKTKQSFELLDPQR